MKKSQTPISLVTDPSAPKKHKSLAARATFEVLSPHSDERLDKLLMTLLRAGLGHLDPPLEELRQSSRSQLQRLIEQGHVHIDGAPALSRSKVSLGSKIQIQFPEPESLELTPEHMELEILFEDEHLLVLNKPQGLTVHPSETQKTGTLVHGLLAREGSLSGIGGKLRPGIVHRLDKDTSGVLLITKSDLAHTRMSEVFAQHRLERRYWALCYGVPKFPDGRSDGRLITPIGRHPTDRKRMSTQVERGREAITDVRVLACFRSPHTAVASWIEARLETGRTHQVRVHLAHLGASVLGDPLYGVPSTRAHKWTSLPLGVQTQIRALPGQALHARMLAFKHPISGKDLHFEGEAPTQFLKLLGALQEIKS
jgi:23S rRNA pseudouridine1911/1915/1917 synthase